MLFTLSSLIQYEQMFIYLVVLVPIDLLRLLETLPVTAELEQSKKLLVPVDVLLSSMPLTND